MKELIVPIRDRRQHRRILTLKNFASTLLVMIVLLVGITVAAALRHPNMTDDFGRLYGRQLPSATSVPKKPEIVYEAAPIADANSADPMLVAPAAREQILLGSNAQRPAPAVASMTPPAPSSSARMTIVGGPEGVSIVRQNEMQPVLGGGFMRQ